MIAFEVKNVLSLEEKFSAGEPKKVWVGFATGPRDVKKAETLLLLTKGIFVLTGCMFLSIHRLPPIGRPMVLKEDKKTVKAHVAMVSISRS